MELESITARSIHDHIADLFESPIHFAAHAPFLTIGSYAVPVSMIGPKEGLSHHQALGIVVAYMPIVLVAQEISFKQRVMNERLEDG
jgi:hypothetical protein